MIRADDPTPVIFTLLVFGGLFAAGFWLGWTSFRRYSQDGFPRMLIPEFLLRWMERILQ